MNWAAELWRGTLDLVFAPVCVGCDAAIEAAEPERLVCRVCWSRMRPVPAPRCPLCWAPLRPGTAQAARCAACLAYPAALRAVRSAYVLGEPVRQIVHALKYKGWGAVAKPLAQGMATLPLPDDVDREASTVVPVPITPARERERGYNQAGLLAQELAHTTGRRCLPGALLRVRSNATQTTLHPDERRTNVAGAFGPGDVATLQGEHVLLVDDVWTTGATAIECTGTLLAAGARAVSVLTFARAIPGIDRPSP